MPNQSLIDLVSNKNQPALLSDVRGQRDVALERGKLQNQTLSMQNSAMAQQLADEPVLRDIRARAAQGDQLAQIQLYSMRPEQFVQMKETLSKQDAGQREADKLQRQQTANQIMVKLQDPNTRPEERAKLLPILAEVATFEQLSKATTPQTEAGKTNADLRSGLITPEQAATPDSGGGQPMNVKEYQYWTTLSPEKKQEYLSVKRAAPKVDLGDSIGIIGANNEIAHTFKKGLAPNDEPAVKAEQATAQEIGKAKGQWQASEPVLLNAIGTMTDKNQVIDQSIDLVKSLLSGGSAEFGAVFKSWPASEANRVRNLLSTIKANVGFAALQEMRDNSPTGGALGQVSEMENKLLQLVWGSLEQTGDISDMARVLDQIKNQRAATLDRLKQAYEFDKDRYGSTLPEGAKAPTMPQSQETKVLDGVTYIKQGDQWYQQ